MTTMKRIPEATPHSLAAYLGAAQSDADRFFGDGQVRIWRPAFDWRPWAAGAVLVTAAAVALLWLWRTTGPLPEHAPAAAADHLATVAMAPPVPQVARPEAAPDTAAAPAARGCGEAACVPLPASGEAPMPAANPAAMLVLPENLEDWALDPQPLAAPADPRPLTQSLFNTPVVPDELDPTPADETAPEDEPVEAPAE
jgi:hypothetical protein